MARSTLFVSWHQDFISLSIWQSVMSPPLSLSLSSSHHCWALHRKTQLGFCFAPYHFTFSPPLCPSLRHLYLPLCHAAMMIYCCKFKGKNPSLFFLQNPFCYVTLVLITQHSVFITESSEPYLTEPKGLQLLAWIRIYRCFVLALCESMCVCVSVNSLFSSCSQSIKLQDPSGVTKYGWRESLTCRNSSKPLSQLGI